MLEPLVVGMAVAFSPAAPWIALMTVAAFFIRQPLKVFCLSRGNNAELSSAAFRFLMLFLAVAAIGFAASMWTAGPWSLSPFAVAVPLALQQVYFDLSKRSRSLVAEVSGAVAIAASAASILLAGGVTWPAAMALWAVLISRFVPSILYVRSRLLLEKGKNFELFAPVAAHIAGLAVVIALATFGLASWPTVGVLAFLTARSVWGLSAYRTKMKAMKIGLWEVGYGVLFVASIIAGHYMGI